MKCSSASWPFCMHRLPGATDHQSAIHIASWAKVRAAFLARIPDTFQNVQMIQLLLQLLRVVVLRSGPQDLPAGWAPAGLMVLIYVALGMLADSMLQLETNSLRSLLSIALQIMAVTVLLRFGGHFERLPQTITAAAGTGCLFGLISIVLLAQSSGGSLPAGMATLWLGLFIWSLVVDAHIYRSALSTRMSVGILIAVLLFALNFIVIDALFPAPQEL